MHSNALHIIRSIQKKWVAISLASYVLMSFGFALVITYLLHLFFDLSFWYVLIFVILFFIILLLSSKSWRLKEKEIIRFLNKNYPSLEESCELLVKDPASLNILGQLQYSKTLEALQYIEQPSLFAKIKRPVLILTVSVITCLLISFSLHIFQVSNVNSLHNAAPDITAKLPAGINEVHIKIVPPSYTHKAAYEQQNMNLVAEEGAAVHWELKTHGVVSTVQFIYNDSLRTSLHPDATHTIWKTDKIMEHTGFYQLQTDSTVSELYKMEVIKDQPPTIIVASPKLNTVIEIGEPAKVNLQATVSDDYGVKDVMINATIAKGSGEGVKFKEQKLSFGTSFASQQIKYALQRMIDLSALDMEPGDELYFYINAIDNHGQEKRSDIFIVSITDTAKLMSMDGLLNGVNLKPDYFRSQRQIIIESEQLIKDKDTALTQNFNNRSNNLGIDQKLLRLRYGKFLGEEASSNDNSTGGDNSLDAVAFGDATQMLDAFTDKHDNSEDASFLDPETKKQLKAVLNEMWSAELRLRLFKPQAALPFEYKALRLLKDLQQKSRAYVAKTSIKTAPIKLEKRLTGKLEKIIEPVTKNDISPAAKPGEELRNALSVLEQLKKSKVTDQSLQVLRLASIQISNNAAKDPASYLKPLESIKRIIQSVQADQLPSYADIIVSQRALQKIAGVPLSLPSKKQRVPGLSLSQQYFKNLKKAGAN